ncbi:hypothetical protein NBRC116493_23170 [Aurantivibrio infirmus]
MSYFEKINNHKYIYLGSISEPEDNSLRLTIEEAVSGEEEDIEISGVKLSGSRALEVTDKSCIYEIVFETYVGYSVLDESYTIQDDHEIFEGRLFCIYSKSHFLDYISKATFASDDHPGPYKHYAFNCLNHIVDVASTRVPRIEQIKST